MQQADIGRQEERGAAYAEANRKAEEPEPSLAGYHLLTGQVLKRVGKTADAPAYAKFVADRWVLADHDEAVELWNILPAADRPCLESASLETELEALEKETQLSEGRIKSVSCSDADNERFLCWRVAASRSRFGEKAS